MAARRSVLIKGAENLPLIPEKEEQNGDYRLQHKFLPEKSFYMPRRFILVAMCIFTNFLCYADRTNISVAVIAMSQEYGWTPSYQGYILSAFFYGYTVTQIPGGLAASTWGPKVVLAIGVLGWSICTILTAVCAFNIPLLIFVRVLLGAAEGVTYPCIHQFSAHWFPVHERARTLTMMTSAQYLGILGAFAIAPYIMETIGWRYVFYIFGMLGFFWYLPFYFLIYSTPEQHPTIRQEEITYIRDNLPPPAPPTLHLLWFLKEKSMWAIIVAHFCNNYGGYIIISWLGIYFESLGVKTSALGIAVIPYFAGYCMSNLSGWLSDVLYKRHILSQKWIRKLCNTIAMVIPAICFMIIILAEVRSIVPAVILICIGYGFTGFSHSGFWVNVIDIGRRYSGQTLGLTNTFASIPGILGNTITGQIVESTGNYDTVFVTMVASYLFGASFFLIYSDSRTVFE